MVDHLLFFLKRFDTPPNWSDRETMDVTYVEFSPEERELYKAVEERARVRINKYLKEGTAPGNYSNILAMLVRLRQVRPASFS